jgi:hypothetical protein
MMARQSISFDHRHNKRTRHLKEGRVIIYPIDILVSLSSRGLVREL